MDATVTNDFDEYGNYHGTIPKQAVEDCTGPGPADESIEAWIDEFWFVPPRQLAIDYLLSFGAWPLESDEYDTGLNDMSDRDITEKVFWIACCDIKENGEWIGLVL